MTTSNYSKGGDFMEFDREEPEGIVVSKNSQFPERVGRTREELEALNSAFLRANPAIQAMKEAKDALNPVVDIRDPFDLARASSMEGGE